MKWVKQRAVTIHRRRAMELAQQEGDEMLQGLYSEAQTEMYMPDPVIDVGVPCHYSEVATNRFAWYSGHSA